MLGTYIDEWAIDQVSTEKWNNIIKMDDILKTFLSGIVLGAKEPLTMCLIGTKLVPNFGI